MSRYLLKLSGRSGCHVQVLDSNGSIIVRKRSKDLTYNPRFEKQIYKQKSFVPIKDIETPNILQIHNIPNTLISLDMEYIYGEKFSNFFQFIGKNELDDLVNKFKYYYLHVIDQCIHGFNPKHKILDKFIETITFIEDQDLKFLLNNYFSKLPSTEIPVGHCHGDFTLSNMLFLSNKIYLFDFLDSYIESPLIDMAKLRQDTKFGWSIVIDSKLEPYKIIRSNQVLHYLDSLLYPWFMSFNWYKDWYIYVELLNFMRILPYIKSRNEKLFVLNCIKEILYNEINNSNCRTIKKV